MKRAAIYTRVSTVDQHPESQLRDLEVMAQQRGLEIVQHYTDRITGTRARRPGLDQMMADARSGQFDIVLVWASDRVARSTSHFLEVLDELNHLGIEFISSANSRHRRSTGPGGCHHHRRGRRTGAHLIVERVRAGMRRAKLDGTRLGRPPLHLDRDAIVRDRSRGLSLRQLADLHRTSRTSIIPACSSLRTEVQHEP